MAPKDDKRARVVADGVVEFYLANWSDSKPASGRSQTAPEAVRLRMSNQLDVAILAQKDAVAARAGEGRFAKDGAVALCALAVFKDHVMVTREDLLKPIVEKIVQPLQNKWDAISADLTGGVAAPFAGQEIGIPLHSVATDLYQRGPLPAEKSS